MKYRKLDYADMDIICHNPQALLECIDPKEQYIGQYEFSHLRQPQTYTALGTSYHTAEFAFVGHDGQDEYSKNLYYVYREDGIYLRKETNLKNDLRHGVQRGFYENGALWTEENYKDGKHDGLRVLYNGDGRLNKVAMYKENMPLCDVTLKMRFLQQIKSIFSRDDVATSNDAQWSRLKKRYPDLNW